MNVPCIRYSLVFQTGRLLVHIYGYLGYKTIVYHTAVNKIFRQALQAGIRVLAIDRPAELDADIGNVMRRFAFVRKIIGTRFGIAGAKVLSDGITEMVKAREAPTAIRELELSAAGLADAGLASIADILSSGACKDMELLQLAANQVNGLAL